MHDDDQPGFDRRKFLTAATATAVGALALPITTGRARADEPPVPPGRAGKPPVREVDPDGRLSVLASLAAETRNPDNTHTIILQHVIPTIREYIEIVNTVYPVDMVITIPYSTDLPTVDYLRSKGFNVVVPRDLDFMLNDLWRVVADHLAKVKYPVIIQEIGGYFAEWTTELTRASPHGSFKGCVEDTKNGLWRYQAAAKKKPLACPVVSMADTALKRVEDSLIGDACVYSLEKVMRVQMQTILDGLRCGVVGWGNIGKSCATALRGRQAVVGIYDIDPVVTMLAYGRGYLPLPLNKLLSECDLVIGCSGRRSIRVADLPDFKDGLILCSASSKQIEIDLVGLGKLCDIQDLTPKTAGACSVEKYTVRATGKTFYVLYRGQPIDFLDTPLQGKILDCTTSELFSCIRELSSHPHPPGVVELTAALQIAVADRWLMLHSQVFAAPAAANDKVYSYPQSLDWE